MPASPAHFDALPDPLQISLLVLLPHVSDQTKTTLIKALRAMGVRASVSRLVASGNFDERANKLIDTGWLKREEHGKQILFCLVPEQRNAALWHWLQSADRLALLKVQTALLSRIDPWMAPPTGRLRHALWRGDRPTLDARAQAILNLMGVVMQRFAHGALGEMHAILREWLAEVCKQIKKRKIELPPILNAFYCLPQIQENDPRHYPALKQALQLGRKQGHGPAYALLQLLKGAV